jgi:hypothetical protein
MEMYTVSLVINVQVSGHLDADDKKGLERAVFLAQNVWTSKGRKVLHQGRLGETIITQPADAVVMGAIRKA